jgi:hypothetical protein
LTASSLADYCHRPSLSLSPDDMGLEPETFANRLSLYSELSFRWGAVLILFVLPRLTETRFADGRVAPRQTTYCRADAWMARPEIRLEKVGRNCPCVCNHLLTGCSTCANT